MYGFNKKIIFLIKLYYMKLLSFLYLFFNYPVVGNKHEKIKKSLRIGFVRILIAKRIKMRLY